LQVVAVPSLHKMKYAQTRQTTGSHSQRKLLDYFGTKESFEDSDVNSQFIIDK